MKYEVALFTPQQGMLLLIRKEKRTSLDPTDTDVMLAGIVRLLMFTNYFEVII